VAVLSIDEVGLSPRTVRRPADFRTISDFRKRHRDEFEELFRVETSKVAKHFCYEITEDAFTFGRDEAQVAEETALDGIYVIRTNVPEEELGAEEAVRAYEQLAEVEKAFRVMKGFALEVEPIRHRLPQRIRAHVFCCMLAYYVRLHMGRALTPLLLTDHRPL